LPEYKEIEGQCGTCGWAKEFHFADSPSGPEDAVNCASETLARALGDWGIWHEQGYVQIWRLEALAEETFRCQHWDPK